MMRGDGEDNDGRRKLFRRELERRTRCFEGKRGEEKRVEKAKRDLASHPPTITSPHVPHCEGRKNKNDKKDGKRSKVEISTLDRGGGGNI